MPSLAVTGERDVAHCRSIRPATPCDRDAVADLLNRTWGGHDLFEPTSSASLAAQIERTQALDYRSLLVLEDEGRISACVALWDWSRIMRITVLRLNARLRLLGSPRPVGQAAELPRTRRHTQADDAHDDRLRVPRSPCVPCEVRQNLALAEGIEQVFCICEPGDGVLEQHEGIHEIRYAREPLT